MQRFYVHFALSRDFEISDTSLHHQITRVLRSQEGDSIILFDGDGKEYVYEITHITKKTIRVQQRSERIPHTEPSQSIRLMQALPNKFEKIEYIIEKGVEVGIRQFTFFRSDFSQKLIVSEAKQARFHIIAREALEQCGGLILPEIIFTDTLGEYSKNDTNVVLDTTGKAIKLSEMPQNKEIVLWVGPEGGWSENERNKMNKNGFIFVRFGERVMRTETAGVVTAFSLLHA